MHLVSTRRAAIEAAILLLLLPALFFGLRFAARRYTHTAFPLAYADLVNEAAAQYDFDPSLIFAVIHTESGFSPEAVSAKQARGLMQITEDTFLWEQTRSAQAESLSAQQLYDPAVNIRYGVYILSLLREQFDDPDTVLAAYNAGIGRVTSWLEDPAYSADGHTLSRIPFAETAAYVQKVNRTGALYRRLYGIS